MPAEDDVFEKKIKYAPFREFLCVVEKYYPERFSGEPKKFDQNIENGQMYLPPFFILNEDDSVKKYYIDEILAEIMQRDDFKSQHIVRRVIFEHIIGASYRRNYNLYKQFTNNILRNRSKDDVTIISFNFDALLQLSVEPRLEEGVYFDYMLNFDFLNREYYKHVPNNCFPLIKLHGSLDWGICRKCGKTTLNFYYPHVQNFTGCSDCKTEYEPFIVVPHEKIEDKRIKQLWDRAGEEIKLADKITVIGYSFPEYDTNSIKLFRDNITDGTLIEVVDYKVSEKDKNKVISHYKKQLGDTIYKKASFNFDGFEKFLSNLN